MNINKMPRRKLFLLFGDIFLIILSINVAFIIRVKKTIIAQLGLNEAIMIIFIMLIICLISFYSFDLYNINNKFTASKSLSNITASLILIILISIILFYLFPYIIGRGVFLISLSFIGISTVGWRMIYSYLFKFTISERNILIVGTGSSAKAIFSILKNNPEYRVVGFIKENLKKKKMSDMNILGDSFALEEIVQRHNISDIILSKPFISNKNLNKSLMKCKLKGISIYDLATLSEYLVRKLPLNYIEERWFLYSNGFNKLGNRTNKRIKRMVDVLFSIFLLMIFFPVMLIISILIKIDSKGPIFYKQERVGQNNKPFNIIKFRTMRKDAEKNEPKWAEDNDPRVTAVGKILRKTRLDELPQLINVIKGEMSLVGPRPERDFFVRRLLEKIPYYSLRFSVKPGLTGWAQINHPYGASEKEALEKLQYELYYIKNMSIFLDLRILLKTIRIVLLGMGR